MKNIRNCLIAAISIASTLLPCLALANEPEQLTFEEDTAFEAVFANPADLMLNFRLVVAQLRNGNVKGAVATLERILTLESNNSQAQALLANSQYRLGNIAEAQQIANQLLANPSATPEQKENIQTLLERINEAEKLFSVGGVITVGGGVIDNPQGASINNEGLFEGQLGTLDKKSDAKEFYTQAVSLNISNRFVSQLPEHVTLGLHFARRDVTDYNLADTESLGVSLGYVKEFQSVQLALGSRATALKVDNRDYLENYSLYANAQFPFGGRWLASGTLSNAWNRYRNDFDEEGLTGLSEPSQRTGQTRSLSLRVARNFDQFQLGTTLGGSENDARGEHNSYRRYSGLADVRFAALGGVAMLGVSHRSTAYSEPDARYHPTEKREDSTNSVMASYSMGLGETFQLLDQQPRLGISIRSNKTKSNIANFSREDGEMSITITQPF